MGKVFLGALLGALCGALLTAVVLLEPSTSLTAQSQNGTNSADSTSPKGQMGSMNQTRQDNQERQLGELQHLLGSLENAGRISPAGRSQLQREFEDLVLIDPIATAELIVETISRHKRAVLRQFLGFWIESEGVDLVNNLPAGWRESHPLLYREVFQALANSNPEATLPHILAMPPSDMRPALMGNIAYALDVEKMPEFFLSLTELTKNEQLRFVEWDSIELANKVPRRLLAWSSTLSEPQRSMAAQSALEGLARVDPRAALTLVDDQSASNKPRIVRSALRQLATTEPQLAVAEAETRGRFFAEVARVWANDDPVSAARWLIERTPEARSSSHDPLMNIASSWAKHDLNAALEFAETLPEDLRGGWTSAVAAQIELNDPDRLETLAQALSDTPYAAGIYTRLAFQRYNTDPEGALSQVLSLKLSLRDKPLSSLIDRAMEHTPESAALLIGEITDQEIRMRTLRKVLRRWQRAEDGAMERWLANQTSPSLRDEAYATLAAEQPKLLASIKDRGMRVATYLGIQHRSRSTTGVRKLLDQIDLSETQWEALDSAATAAAK
ncbi:MAG: hypothetical protein GKR90_14155 [Pseudomonadales bacterium]|nr:hypothetical protein [Pseudomonadales bacterium]